VKGLAQTSADLLKHLILSVSLMYPIWELRKIDAKKRKYRKKGVDLGIKIL
jgi:hypothetical protein